MTTISHLLYPVSVQIFPPILCLDHAMN